MLACILRRWRHIQHLVLDQNLQYKLLDLGLAGNLEHGIHIHVSTRGTLRGRFANAADASQASVAAIKGVEDLGKGGFNVGTARGAILAGGATSNDRVVIVLLAFAICQHVDPDTDGNVEALCEFLLDFLVKFGHPLGKIGKALATTTTTTTT